MLTKALCLLGLAATCVVAEDDYPVLVYPVPHAAAAPQLDGKLGDAAWTDAPVCSGFTWYNRQELLAVQTTVRWVYTDDALYLGVWCDEPNVKELHPTQVPRDAHQVFSTEAIEVFLDPQHNHADYYQLAVNAAGSLFDSRGQEPSWNSGAEAAAVVGEQGWSLELKLPFKSFGIAPHDGLALGANVCRDRTLKAREWSNWSQTKANFHDPERFAHLVLSPTAEQLAGLADEFRKGDRTGPLQIFSRDGIGSETYAAMAARRLARVDAQWQELKAIRDGEDAATRAELTTRMEAYSERLAPLRQNAQGQLDGGGFTRLELELTKLVHELGALVWQARLSALLGSI